eukprot:g2857.t1
MLSPLKASVPLLPAGGMSADWIKTYEQTERTLRDAISTLRNKGAGRGKGRRLLMKSIEQAQANIQQLENNIAGLESSKEIGSGEAQRRRQLVSDLYALNTNAQEILSGAKRRNDIRQQAMARGDTEETRGLSNTQLLEAQQTEMERQDQQLDGILDGLDLHESLLQDLQPMIENADGRVVRNVDRVQDISENQGGWCPFICATLLLAFIVFLLSSNSLCVVFNKDRC